MPTAETSVDVFFDYTCPFAYRAHHWLDAVDITTRWRPFSLLERNYRGDGPPVWRLPERADDVSLLLFAGHEWIRAQDADLDAYRHAAFHAWHETAGRLEADDVVAFARQAGAQGGEETLREHFLDAEAEHDVGRQAGVFGSPTLIFGAAQAAFVKLAAPPPAEEADELLATARAIAARSSLLEIKRPVPPNAERPGRALVGLSSR